MRYLQILWNVSTPKHSIHYHTRPIFSCHLLPDHRCHSTCPWNFDLCSLPPSGRTVARPTPSQVERTVARPTPSCATGCRKTALPQPRSCRKIASRNYAVAFDRGDFLIGTFCLFLETALAWPSAMVGVILDGWNWVTEVRYAIVLVGRQPSIALTNT